MATPKFFQAVLIPVEGDVLEHVYPWLKTSNVNMTLEERLGHEDAKCSECGGNEWYLLPKESAAVTQGGKPYIECMGCGASTHL